MQNFEGFKYTFILALALMVSLCQNNRDGHTWCRHLVAEISGNFFLLHQAQILQKCFTFTLE